MTHECFLVVRFFFPNSIRHDLICFLRSILFTLGTSLPGPPRSTGVPPEAQQFRNVDPDVKMGSRGNSVPLTSLPQIEGGCLRLARRRSPVGARAQQQQQQQRQDGRARARSARAPGRQAPRSQPHAARSRSRVRIRDAAGRESSFPLGTSS